MYLRKVFDIYYSSKLAEQIANESYGIENMDAKYLAEDLIENEAELFGIPFTMFAEWYKEFYIIAE